MGGLAEFLEKTSGSPDRIHVYRGLTMCVVFYKNKIAKLKPGSEIHEQLLVRSLDVAECGICARLNHGFRLCSDCYMCVCKSCYTRIRTRCPYCRGDYQ